MQTVQHKLAEMKTDICVGRAFVDQCMKLHSEKRLDSGMASMAKYWCVGAFVLRGLSRVGRGMPENR